MSTSADRLNHVGTTVTQHIAGNQSLAPGARGELTHLLMEMAVTCKLIASKIQRAGIAEDILGKEGAANSSGDDQAKLDVISHQTLVHRILPTGTVCAIVSEEEEGVIVPEEGQECGDYVVCTDPLDGSSNIDCNVPVGTIFGIYHRVSPNPDRKSPGTDADIFQAGKDLVCSGYVLYGSSVMFVYTTGHGVHGFTLDPSIGEFILSHPNITIPEKCKNYSVNEGNSHYWSEGQKDFISHLKSGEGKKPMGARYVGSLVSDFHRNMLYGGLFMYPGDSRAPNGKLRLLYECIPMAHLAVNAGGAGTDGLRDILDIIPTSYHQRVPFYVGNTTEVELAREYLSRDEKK